MDTPPSGAIGWLDDPGVTFGLGFLQLHVVSMEFVVLVWQNIGVRDEIIILDSILLLGFYKIEAEAVFAGDLIAHWEVINPLKFVQALIEERFA